MNINEQRQAARDFADRWKDRGYEKGEGQKFWIDLLHNVLGMENVLEKCEFEQLAPNGGFPDVYIPDCDVIIEQKGLHIDLDKPELRQNKMVTPFEQVLGYTQSYKHDLQPTFLITCNFETFRVYDRNRFSDSELEDNVFEFTLEELADNPHYLGFIVDPANSRTEKEKQVSFEAGRLIGELYTELHKRFIDPDSPESQHALNVLCVRLVFCLFCEDAAGLFQKDAFLNYLKDVPASNIRSALKTLFRALDTSVDKRDPYDENIKVFPYVGGGLFSEETEIPNFDDELKRKLLDDVSAKTDWSKISPTIFGGIFEGTLNPETRRSGGMHYTSPENIHKVIDPLFFDDLKAEFKEICEQYSTDTKKKTRGLAKLHEKITSLSFLDPAAGSGNFLTETYLCLRKLEDDIFKVMRSGQTSFLTNEITLKRVSLSQFYGIEINDFAVRVARVALWIASLQANNNLSMISDYNANDFPLTDAPNIIHANALRLDWNEVLPATECNYIIGNPPFIGHQWRNKSQQEDMELVFDDLKGSGKLDYVGCWFEKARLYVIDNPKIMSCFVATNSICQGESVGVLWKHFAKNKIHINFAYRSFVWSNEASDQAHVHVVIVGFSMKCTDGECKLFTNEESRIVSHINGYLSVAPDVFIEGRGKPVNPNVPKMTKGSQPTDDGNLILTASEREKLIEKYPKLHEVIKPYVGGKEFLNGGDRWCLWFNGVEVADYIYPEITERLNRVTEARLKSPTKSVREAAATPMLFTQIRQPDTSYIVVPEVSSEKRKLIPIGLLSSSVIASNQLRFIPTDSLFIFGNLSSLMHACWMKVVAGRLKSDYRYSPAVYNSFVFPNAGKEQKMIIEKCAKDVLEARDYYEGKTLAELYDPDKEVYFSKLSSAHKALDDAVEDAYGISFNGNEEKIVAHLFELYEGLVSSYRR